MKKKERGRKKRAKELAVKKLKRQKIRDLKEKITNKIKMVKDYYFVTIIFLFLIAVIVWEFELIGNENPLWIVIYGIFLLAGIALSAVELNDFCNNESSFFDLIKTIILTGSIIFIVLKDLLGVR